MGDWLDTGTAFGGNVGKAAGRRFVSAASNLPSGLPPLLRSRALKVFKEHPDWFIKDADGMPLLCEQVWTFQGWRRGPWYALDGTNPEVQKHFETLFRTMRNEWGCTYFKLDANFWGAMHGGRLHDPNATRIERTAGDAGDPGKAQGMALCPAAIIRSGRP